MQADLLGLSRASLYYQPRPPSAEEVRLKHRIDEIYTQCPFYGSRKLAAQLQREGRGINRKTVGRYMSEMGIAAIYPGANLSKRNQKEGVYPYATRAISRARTRIIFGASTSRTFAYKPAGGAILPAHSIVNSRLAANVQISMDGKGRALDNIFTERHSLIRPLLKCIFTQKQLGKGRTNSTRKGGK
jgi:hypothetical protein